MSNNYHLLSIIVGLGSLVRQVAVAQECFADPNMTAQWAKILTEDDTATTFTVAEDSCCQETVCGIPCAAEVSPPAKVRRHESAIALCCVVSCRVVSCHRFLFVIYDCQRRTQSLCSLTIIKFSSSVLLHTTIIGIWRCRHRGGVHICSRRFHDCICDQGQGRELLCGRTLFASLGKFISYVVSAGIETE